MDRVVKPAKSLANAGVEIFPVVTSRAAVRQFQKIATTKQHLIVVRYNDLVSITDRLKNKICVTPSGEN